MAHPRFKDLAIAAFLCLQIGLPLSYYQGQDPYDERFAWRMFSTVRLSTCQVKLFDSPMSAPPAEAERELSLHREMHMVWLGLLKRGRVTVLRAFARVWCENNRGRALRAELVCAPPQALSLAICQGNLQRALPNNSAASAPALYNTAASRRRCAALSPAECFAKECGELDAATCRAERCSERLVPRHANLCEAPP